LNAAVFVDTWAWIALASADDQYHAVARQHHADFQAQHRPYITSNFVLNELITHLYRKQHATDAQRFIAGIWKAVEDSACDLHYISAEQFERAWQLRTKYSDKPSISFTDFTSMVLMKELGVTDVFSGDAHFEHVGMGFRLVP
jgi:predicted nucleic acid-binding protein